MTSVTVETHGRRVIVARPDGSERGRLSVDMLLTLAQAKAENAAACFLRPETVASEAIFSLTSDEVRVGCPGTQVDRRTRWRWHLARWADDRRAKRADAGASFWLEWYRELRRHVADERLPIDLRGRMREAAHRAFERSQQRRAPVCFPRTRLRDRVSTRLPEDLLERARAAARDQNVEIERPFVAVDTRARAETLNEMYHWLASHGYRIVPLGRSALLDVYALLACNFLICDNSDVQRTAYLTNTPTLAINAGDAYAFYPVRSDGVYLLKTAVDLDTGRALQRDELLGEAFYRNLRNCGYRDNTAAEIRAAAAEMVEGLQSGWHDSDGQIRFRALATATGESVGHRIRHVAKWGPVDGFIGDGRMARIQADRAA